jgi:hypothetical protein
VDYCVFGVTNGWQAELLWRDELAAKRREVRLCAVRGVDSHASAQVSAMRESVYRLHRAVSQLPPAPASTAAAVSGAHGVAHVDVITAVLAEQEAALKQCLSRLAALEEAVAGGAE